MGECFWRFFDVGMAWAAFFFVTVGLKILGKASNLDGSCMISGLIWPLVGDMVNARKMLIIIWWDVKLERFD